MLRTVISVAASAVLGLCGAVAILTDAYPHEGPYVSLSASHGIHVGDLVIVGVWATLTTALLIWARRGRVRQH